VQGRRSGWITAGIVLATFAAAGFRAWHHQPLAAPSSPAVRLAANMPAVAGAAPFEPTRAFADLFGIPTGASELPTGPQESTTLWHEQAFGLEGAPALVVFTQTQRLLADGQQPLGRSEPPSISAAVYRLGDGHWKLASTSRDFARAGAWGEAPPPRRPLETLAFPDGAVAFLVDQSGGGMGYTQVGKSVWAYAHGEWHDLGFVQTGGDNEGAAANDDEPYSFSGSIAPEPGASPYPDLLVARSGTMHDENEHIVPATDTRYVFTGRSYEEAPQRH
jgi:hypothetical protein